MSALQRMTTLHAMPQPAACASPCCDKIAVRALIKDGQLLLCGCTADRQLPAWPSVQISSSLSEEEHAV